MKTTTTKVRTIEYKTKRNTRFESYKGRYNCEVSVNGSYFCDGQGDTVAQAEKWAKAKIDRAAKEGQIVLPV